MRKGSISEMNYKVNQIILEDNFRALEKSLLKVMGALGTSLQIKYS